jgi:cyclin H
MDFNRSTQARSWLFDEDSLAACRERAAAEASAAKENEPRVRKFASGFHSRFSKEREGSTAPNELPNSSVPTLSPSDKETLVRFHAHQIQALVGPTALLSELCTSETVLSSAIMYFRRFYLSNCILDINPRKMAAACAFFAAKAEEERIDVSSHCRMRWKICSKFLSCALCMKSSCLYNVYLSFCRDSTFLNFLL